MQLFNHRLVPSLANFSLDLYCGIKTTSAQLRARLGKLRIQEKYHESNSKSFKSERRQGGGKTREEEEI